VIRCAEFALELEFEIREFAKKRKGKMDGAMTYLEKYVDGK
jgi:hypothetical protein